jgi:hypothetical protein
MPIDILNSRQMRANKDELAHGRSRLQPCGRDGCAVRREARERQLPSLRPHRHTQGEMQQRWVHLPADVFL